MQNSIFSNKFIIIEIGNWLEKSFKKRIKQKKICTNFNKYDNFYSNFNFDFPEHTFYKIERNLEHRSGFKKCSQQSSFRCILPI